MQTVKNTVQFVIDGKTVEIDFNKSTYSPTTTVLNYLRGLPNHKGVKEGCAEGDCGACTVVFGELQNGKLTYKAIDACLVFLPMLHGKQLIAVENVGTSKNLHPVQEVMVETDGSQCGYCTPGFIMSLFGLYKTCHNPSREVIDDALTGNLCRCTGYRPIAEAAAKACVNNKDSQSDNEPRIKKLLLSIKKNTLSIITSKQKYFRPVTLNEALKLKMEYPAAILFCGATDLALRVTKGKELLEELIDLNGVEEIQQLKETKNGLVIGAGVSLEKIKSVCKKQFYELYAALAVFGSKQIRELATLGGNLASASPIGDMAPILMAYSASVILAGNDGEREIPAIDFITGYRKTIRRPNEIIKEVCIPKVKKDVWVKFYKISKRKDLDISTVSGGFNLKLYPDGKVANICLVYGGMAAMTKRASRAEKHLIGKTWEKKTVLQAMNLIDKEFSPISDARSGAEGRKIMARNLLLKFWTHTMHQH